MKKVRKKRASLDAIELMSTVLDLICKGKNPTEIQKVINRDYPDVEFNRESTYKILREAAQRGLLQFTPPLHLKYEERLRHTYPWLQHVSVVRTTTVEHVSVRTAVELLRLVRALYRRRRTREVHIGFAGGHSMRSVVREFARLLCEPMEDLPQSIVFHAIVAGFQPEDPTTEPNTFFTHMDDPSIQIIPKYKALSAPSMVTPELIPKLRMLDDIKDAFQSVEDIDIFVTSGSDWRDEHSALLMRMQKSPASMKVLEDNKCVGDILWRPIAKKGPINDKTAIRALTLIELDELPRFIRDGKRVLLMIGPCAICKHPKEKLLKAILDMETPLVTDLVVDSITAARAVGREADKLDEPSDD